jgi:hypothetical protein
MKNVIKILFILVFIFVFIVSFQKVIRFPKYTENKLFFGLLCGFIIFQINNSDLSINIL